MIGEDDNKSERERREYLNSVELKRRERAMKDEQCSVYVYIYTQTVKHRTREVRKKKDLDHMCERIRKAYCITQSRPYDEKCKDVDVFNWLDNPVSTVK